MKGLFYPQGAHDPQGDKHGLWAEGNTWPMIQVSGKLPWEWLLSKLVLTSLFYSLPLFILPFFPFPSLAHICQKLFLFLGPTFFLPLLLQWSQSLVSRSMMLLSHWELNTLKSLTLCTLASCRTCINNSLLKKLFWWRSRDALLYGANNLGNLICWPFRGKILGPMT